MPEQVFNWFGGIVDGVKEGAKELVEGLIGSVQDVFSKDGILSMKNLTDAGMIYAIGEIMAEDGQEDNMKALTKEFNKFLPAFVESKIRAGRMEQVALDDVNALLNHGIVTERNEAGQITSRKKGPMGGSVDLEYEELYGVKPQYEVDSNNNIILEKDPKTGMMAPKTVRAGRPGQMQIANQAQRDEQYKANMATTRQRIDALDQSGAAFGRGIRNLQGELEPEVQPTQAQAGKSFRDLLRAQDPNRLTGSEMANVSRGLGRMGMGLGRTSEMDKYKAAMTFGDALANKQQRLGQALGQSGNVIGSLKSNVNPGGLFGEGTTTTPTTPGQVTGFGNTGVNALSATANVINQSPGKVGGKERLTKAIFD
tara:strand:+ start:45 stop:1148 length:1104 start_codon:yes stop_codon:yes gene_type:complete